MKKWIVITLLVTVGLFVSYHGLKPAGLFVHKRDVSSQQRFYLVDLETRSFDETGQLTQILLTDKASQQINRQEIRLSKLELRTGGEGDKRWLATADSGLTYPELDRMTLESNVRLSNPGHNTEIETELLMFDGTKEIAYSDKPIRIQAMGSETSATGIHIDFREETVQLKHNVKTYYDPKHNTTDNARSDG